MKNKIIRINFLVIFAIILLVAFSFNNKPEKYINKNGALLALSLDGNKINKFPEKGAYKVDVVCKNANGVWDYGKWELLINDITGNISCELNFNSITKQKFNDYIIKLTGTTQGTGKVVNENGYRYEGKNPNNYVWFNNEYWRIIGVFDNTSHGQSGKKLVKIMRSETLGILMWNNTDVNNWNSSTLNSLLKDSYYNAKDGTATDYCYGDNYYSLKVNCNYTKKGIQSEYRNMIENVTWYLGGYTTEEITADQFYKYEREGNVYSGRPTSGTGYIGLMYVSDYGYSVLASDCPRTTTLHQGYSSATCASKSWIYGKGNDWTITQYSKSPNAVLRISPDGFIILQGGTSGYGVRPNLYLNDSVYIIDGDGSYENPYIIGM